MTEKTSPWYEKKLLSYSKPPPNGFDVFTVREDINKDNLLVAIDNKSVPEEAVNCYARLFCDEIKKQQNQKTPPFHLKADTLKPIAETLITQVYQGHDINIIDLKKRDFRKKTTRNTSLPTLLSAILPPLQKDSESMFYSTNRIFPVTKGATETFFQLLLTIPGRPDDYKKIFAEFDQRIQPVTVHNGVLEYCWDVISLYRKAFLTPFLFKVKGQPAFLVNTSHFINKTCLPSMNDLDKLFKENTKLKDQMTVKKELGTIDSMAEHKILSPKGRERTFAQDIVRFLYQILYDDTTVGRKGQEQERVQNINPYLLRTTKTTLQRPHTDSEMGEPSELGTESKDEDPIGTKRRSKHPKRNVASYNKDADDPTTQEKSKAEID